ncbi:MULTISPECIES: hypothetical protein [unclassified Novosphingobium]|uniref:hypothetical protein n=1 Tax=unclassified Novosphingobium TaxID=2644732 RepID=UPI000D327ABA|nr:MULTISPECIES: hypothetical protein [unclassified Novosphingobium]PTR06395.1 hypothetical protein C8K11_1208 [Novosphingobium sp. GV055]PUA94814.1 hypothetical protein C8K12_1208 [Novosphingobium sp. GV061]PUB13739.1 hypothetical protein C8K14_1208 [Novosphingobium sp. GV079]PUB38437.1 hypothetical protein C8K10_1208 [Novosphingobium sp. GV027]
MPQYVSCRFRPTDTRTYTYVHDGAPLKPGDMVKVADARSDSWKRVEVVAVSDEAPPFTCKPVLGLAEDEGEAAPADGAADISASDLPY